MDSLKHVIAALVLALAACAEPAPAPAPPPPADAQARAVFAADTRTIFAGETARELVSQCSRISPGLVEGTWTPSDAELDALEQTLAPLLDEQPAVHTNSTGASAADYYRQYGGLIIRGRRVIYVNGVHRSVIERDFVAEANPIAWRTRAVKICDGGSIAFGVEYDVASGSFAHFAFNGAL